MTFATLTLKNLRRNPLRTTLTIAAIALPMLVFTIARSLVDGVEQFLVDSDNAMRVAVHQKLTYTAWLPQKLRGEIESLAPPGYIQAICRTSWFGGRVEGVQSYFPNMAVDRDTFPIVYSEFELTPEQIAAFQNERSGAVVATSLANMMNWKLGDRVTLTGTIPPFPKIDFVIVAVVPKMPGPWLYFGLDYYDEIVQQKTGTPIGVNNFWLRCTSPAARQWVLTEIDKSFVNSDHETRTEMESTFMAAFMQSGGNWVGMIWSIGQLIVLVAVAVAFNTMSMTFRERTRELAVMRALGFSASRIVGLVLAEGLVLGLIGGAVATLPLYAITNATEIMVPGAGVKIEIPANTLAIALSVALACGLLAAVVPAVMAGRLAVAPALRKVV